MEIRLSSDTYDPLQRLTAADYSTGTYFHYTYDEVGNRLSQTTQSGVTNYAYDAANRLTNVGGTIYAWDAKGNLLSDGVSTYSYDAANRLTGVTQGASTYAFSYNGLGDRLRQTVNAQTTNYTLDLAAGLTQVLSDGTNTYLYGLGRIGEQQSAGWQYYLGDALGSVRQLTDTTAGVTLAQSYAPYGTTLSSAGGGASAFQFAGEARDGTGLTFLRSRYLDTGVGRFTTRDEWRGDPRRPMSYNAWLYVYADPVNRADPTGREGCGPSSSDVCYGEEFGVCIPGVGCSGGQQYSDWWRSSHFPELAAYWVGPDLPTDRVTVSAEPAPNDLTAWLVGQLCANAKGQVAQALRRYYPWPGAWSGWYSLVSQGGIWDFKRDIGRDIQTEDVVLAGRTYKYDVIANIHYGYVGRAIGFDWQVLVGGAGLAQIKNNAWDPFRKALAQTGDPLEAWEAIHWSNTGPWECNFDPCADLAAITVGMELFEQYGYDVDEERLGAVLERYYDQLNRGTP